MSVRLIGKLGLLIIHCNYLNIAIQYTLLLKKWLSYIVILHYREGLLDKLQSFILYIEFVLITFFCEIFSKFYTDFDSNNMTFENYAHKKIGLSTRWAD